MTPMVQYFLAAGPLAVYFYLLAVWQGGRHPRVIGGFWDAFLLACGLGGLLVFGPAGQAVAASVFRMHPKSIDWLAMASVELMAASLFALRSSRRVVIYHIDPEAFEYLLHEVLDQGPARFERTLRGFQDRGSDLRLEVDAQPVMQTAVVRVYGRGGAAFLSELIRRIRAQLPGVPTRPSPAAGAFAGLSAMTVLLPLVSYVLTQAQARTALRLLLQRLHGG